MRIYNFKTSLKFICALVLTTFLLFFQELSAQSCNPTTNLQPNFYNTEKATFRWDYSSDAGSYLMKIYVNGESYSSIDLPGNASSCSVSFNPVLKHHDKVDAVLTKNCVAGAQSTTNTNFIIITDIIVYLNGGIDEYGKPLGVEPVTTPHTNLDPAIEVCGKCEVDFFRLESGFYSYYDISTTVSSSYPIEVLRFRKSELCGCLDQAIAAGMIGKNGGHGENFKGEPFLCNMKLYIFQKEDCGNENRSDDESLHLNSTESFSIVPNPASESAEIRYHLEQETSTTLALYDITGNLIETYLNNQVETGGDHQVTVDAHNLSPGLYYCMLRTAAGQVQTKKVVVAH
jgi:hypothetical protein